MNQNTKPPIFRTDNLTLAASLNSVGYPVEVEMKTTTKALFLIPQTDQLNLDVSKFWSDELAISPLVFQTKQRELRGKIAQAMSRRTYE